MTGRAQEETTMTTGQLASAEPSALKLTAQDETPIPAWLGPTPREIGTLPLSRLRRVTDFIREHLDQDLTLAQLGGVVYMSPFHFARLFQRSTGLPPHRFVVRARIARAAVLLAEPEPPIAQISRVVGFRTPSHFSTVFRRLMGVTPHEYRAKRLEGARDERN
jgi:AraC-like DNA-binding protein